jgi:hypothetical protein
MKKDNEFIRAIKITCSLKETCLRVVSSCYGEYVTTFDGETKRLQSGKYSFATLWNEGEDFYEIIEKSLSKIDKRDVEYYTINVE